MVDCLVRDVAEAVLDGRGMGAEGDGEFGL